MTKISAGILMYRVRGEGLQVFLVHPGGPFWANKDLGAWSIPKGEIDPAEDAVTAAVREFKEETGVDLSGGFYPLSPVKLKSGKIVQAWAVGGDCDPEAIKSNTFTIEWPPGSGRKQAFPEVDRAEWFGIEEARERINKEQAALIEELVKVVGRPK